MWTARADMPTARSDTATTVLGLNKIIVTGGCDADQICPEPMCYCPHITNKTEVFHPEDNIWETLADMPRPRFRHGMEFFNGSIYVFGGRDVSDVLIQEIDVYNPTKNSWSTLPPSQWLNESSSDFSSLVFNNTIYMVGGYDQNYKTLASVASFTPNVANSTWKYDALPPMNVPRGDTCAIVLNDQIYLFGGFKEDNFCIALDDLEIFDFSQNRWSLGKSMEIRGGDKACGNLHGRFHIFGGEVKDAAINCSRFSIPSPDVQEYDPIADDWQEEPPMPSARFRFNAIYYKHSNGYEAIYTFGGQNEIDVRRDVFPVTKAVWAYSDEELPKGKKDDGIGATAIGLIIALFVLIIIVLVIVAAVAVHRSRKNKSQQAYQQSEDRNDDRVQLEQF